MPYNTRRKSLSLPSLGIQLPHSSRSHRSVLSSASSTPLSASPSSAFPVALAPSQPPPKKVKRSHDSPSDPSAAGMAAASDLAAFNQTPPPSPLDSTTSCIELETKIDTEGISDDIVVAVIRQLESTGNRPHLIKELATVLSSSTESIANSANAAALISSRLSLYLKRPWSAIAPCPIAKELIPVHPRKVFYYLTHTPHQPLPQSMDNTSVAQSVEQSQQLQQQLKELTPVPSTGDAADLDIANDLDDDDVDAHSFQRLRSSLSPEVDLSSHEFDQAEEGDVAIMMLDDASRSLTPGFSTLRGNRRLYNDDTSRHSVPPPLEGDEKEFTLTASLVRERTTATEDGTTRQLHDFIMHGSAVADSSSNHGPMDCDEAALDMDSSYLSPEDSDQNAAEDSTDYFSITHNQATATYGAPPSPSDLSSISSLTSASSDGAETDDDLRLTDQVTDTGANTLPANSTAVLGTRKRSFDMSSSSSSPPYQLQYPGPDGSALPVLQKPTSIATDYNFDFGFESWIDLRSPETVDVAELDAIFADI